eukprot:4099899-Pyramimonas_sp.AAC.1
MLRRALRATEKQLGREGIVASFNSILARAIFACDAASPALAASRRAASPSGGSWPCCRRWK